MFSCCPTALFQTIVEKYKKRLHRCLRFLALKILVTRRCFGLEQGNASFPSKSKC